MTGIALGVLALILVGPGPVWVVRWRFLRRVPRAAVFLWQAGTVAALLSVIGAGVVIGFDLTRAPLPGWLVIITYGVIALFTALVIIRLAWSLVTVAKDTGARRARHRHAVDLLGQVEEGTPNLRILAESLPLAYCLPGTRQSRVVLSSGTLATLNSDELQAVVAHESAHVRARHDLVLDTFTALHRAFPIAVRSEIPLTECRLLVEMLADDSARRTTGPLPLARALVALAGAPVPTTAIGVSQHGMALRVQRLADEPSRSRGLAAGVYALAIGLLLAPVVVFAAGGVIS